MLVPENLIQKFNFFNLHRGDLKTNRDPTPDIWTVLLGLHKINDKIDKLRSLFLNIVV